MVWHIHHIYIVHFLSLISKLHKWIYPLSVFHIPTWRTSQLDWPKILLMSNRKYCLLLPLFFSTRNVFSWFIILIIPATLLPRSTSKLYGLKASLSTNCYSKEIHLSNCPNAYFQRTKKTCIIYQNICIYIHILAVSHICTLLNFGCSKRICKCRIHQNNQI